MKGYSVSSSPSRISGVLFFSEIEVSWPTKTTRVAAARLSGIGASRRDGAPVVLTVSNLREGHPARGSGVQPPRTSAEVAPAVTVRSDEVAGQRAAPEVNVPHVTTAAARSARVVPTGLFAVRAVTGHFASPVMVAIGRIANRMIVAAGLLSGSRRTVAMVLAVRGRRAIGPMQAG